MTGMHTERRPYCRITYWAGNVAAKSDEQWTHCRVELFGMSPIGHEFTSANNRDRFLSFMDDVFERGRNDGKREVREALGIKEPRT